MIREYNGKTPDISKAAFIAETAVIIGDVTLGEGVSVWYGAVLRGDSGPIRVGDYTNIQDNCVLHCDTGGKIEIGKNVLIGHGAIIHGCTICDGAMIGMGAIVMNHAQVGEKSLVGAGALVTERKVFPPEVLVVGHPAKIARKLTPDQKAFLQEAVDVYVDLGKQYRSQDSGIEN